VNEHATTRAPDGKWLSAHTLAKWRLDGRGPEWRRIGTKRVFYPLHSLNAFMAKAG
jgi:hypothetical protein